MVRKDEKGEGDERNDKRVNRDCRNDSHFFTLIFFLQGDIHVTTELQIQSKQKLPRGSCQIQTPVPPSKLLALRLVAVTTIITLLFKINFKCH